LVIIQHPYLKKQLTDFSRKIYWYQRRNEMKKANPKTTKSVTIAQTMPQTDDREFSLCVHRNELFGQIEKLYSLARNDRKRQFTKLFYLNASYDNQSFTISIEDGTNAKFRAFVKTDVSCFVHCDLLYLITREIQKDWLFWSIVDDSLRIECNQTQYNLKQVQLEESHSWHCAVQSRFENEIAVNSLDFQAALKKTIFAVYTEYEQGICTGVNIVIDGTTLTMVATDMKRIAEHQIPLQKSTNISTEITLKKTDCEYLMKFITIDDTLTIRYPNDIDTINPSIEIVYCDKLKEMAGMFGRYPAYKIAFRTEPTHHVVANTATLKKQLKQVMKLSEDCDKLVKFTFTEKTLTLQSVVSDHGNSENSIDIESQYLPDEACVLYLNAKHLLSILSHIDTKQVQFGIVSIDFPVRIEPYHSSSIVTSRYIQMPMKFKKGYYQ
jgi:DNA polymerase III sliding clamp (beta) subunit (PCNA family)